MGESPAGVMAWLLFMNDLCPGGGGALKGRRREGKSGKEDGEKRSARVWLERGVKRGTGEGRCWLPAGLGCLGLWLRHAVCLRLVWCLLKNSLLGGVKVGLAKIYPLKGHGFPQSVFCRGDWSPQSPSSLQMEPHGLRAFSFTSSGAGSWSIWRRYRPWRVPAPLCAGAVNCGQAGVNCAVAVVTTWEALWFYSGHQCGSLPSVPPLPLKSMPASHSCQSSRAQSPGPGASTRPALGQSEPALQRWVWPEGLPAPSRGPAVGDNGVSG